MKRIEYKLTYGEGMETIVAVYARNIASGLKKVAKTCDKNIPAAWGHIHSIEFWMVTS
jgi:hypothetical protein